MRTSFHRKTGESNARGEVFVGIDCGGTRCVVISADPLFRIRDRFELAGANLRLVSDTRFLELLIAVRNRIPEPTGLGIGLAGARSAADIARVSRLVQEVWPGLPHAVDHDLGAALRAAGDAVNTTAKARVIVLSGTGSCCYGRALDGRSAKVGGWGHVLGDRGSAYDLAYRALRALTLHVDHHHRPSPLLKRVLAFLSLKDAEDLIDWAQAASKSTIASLAPTVFAAAVEGDGAAKEVIRAAARSLAADAVGCAQQLRKRNETDSPEFFFAGSVLLNQPPYARAVAREIQREMPKASARLLPREGAWGAVAMAIEAARAFKPAESPSTLAPTPSDPASTPVGAQGAASGELPVTEQRNPRSLHLDRMSVEEAVRLMLKEESEVASNLETHKDLIVQVVNRIVKSFKRGGRLFYVGAGSSGRLGVLDASECPPTFRTSPEQVQGVIAGGPSALFSAVEGAEDLAPAGISAMTERKVGKHDIVIGIAASGRTPYVWGALGEAKRLGAQTVLVCFNPAVKIDPAIRPDVVIAPSLGPEVLTGSTRLKAGSATKILLNMFTTLSMVRMGKVESNLMIDLNPSNTKLRDRAARIVSELGQVAIPEAKAVLVATQWHVAEALKTLRRTRKAKRPVA